MLQNLIEDARYYVKNAVPMLRYREDREPWRAWREKGVASSGRRICWADMVDEAFRLKEIGKNWPSRHPGRTVLSDGPFRPSHPFVAFANFARPIVAAYLGMDPILNSIQLNWSYPFTGPTESTYLWHKDADDRHVVKVIIYFNDVDEHSGPFCYIPETHPFGKKRNLGPKTGEHYIEDALVSDIRPQQTLTGPAGTVIFADTAGFHRGLRPVSGERLALFITFVTKSAKYPVRETVLS